MISARVIAIETGDLPSTYLLEINRPLKIFFHHRLAESWGPPTGGGPPVSPTLMGNLGHVVLLFVLTSFRNKEYSNNALRGVAIVEIWYVPISCRWMPNGNQISTNYTTIPSVVLCIYCLIVLRNLKCTFSRHERVLRIVPESVRTARVTGNVAADDMCKPQEPRASR